MWLSILMDAKILKSKQEIPSFGNFCCSVGHLHHVGSTLAAKLNSYGTRNITIVGYIGMLIKRDDKVCPIALCPEMLMLDLMTTLHCNKPTIITVYQIHTSIATFVDFLATFYPQHKLSTSGFVGLSVSTVKQSNIENCRKTCNHYDVNSAVSPTLVMICGHEPLRKSFAVLVDP